MGGWWGGAAEDQEETGWKYLHGDVFRPPRHLALFAACTGTGAQVFAMAIFIFALALVGAFYPYNRGSLLTACVVSPPPSLSPDPGTGPLPLTAFPTHPSCPVHVGACPLSDAGASANFDPLA